MVELSRDGQLAGVRSWAKARPRVDFGCARRPRFGHQDWQELSRSEATVRSRAGDGDDRALKFLKLDYVLSRASSARFTPASSRDQDWSRSIMLSRIFSAAPG